MLSALATFDSIVIISQSEYITLIFILASVNGTAKLAISYFLFYFLILIFSLVNYALK